MAQVKAVFYVPIKDNDGRSLKAEIVDLESELFLTFVGWTSLGMVKGAWRMADGTQSLDDSEAYALILDESRLSELEEILLSFKNKTTQEAIYLEIHRNVEIRFVRGTQP